MKSFLGKRSSIVPMNSPRNSPRTVRFRLFNTKRLLTEHARAELDVAN